jgi:hypothetical protein
MIYDMQTNNIFERKKFSNNLIKRTSFMFEQKRNFDFVRIICKNIFQI